MTQPHPFSHLVVIGSSAGGIDARPLALPLQTYPSAKAPLLIIPNLASSETLVLFRAQGTLSRVMLETETLSGLTLEFSGVRRYHSEQPN